MVATDVSLFAESQLRLLDQELQAELAETNDAVLQSSPASLQRAGLALLNLYVSAERTGLGGKTVTDLELDPAIGKAELPEHGFRVGDIVGLRDQLGGAAKKREKAEAENKGVDGVVVKVNMTTVSVALDREDADTPAGKLWIVKLANDVTYKRMNQVMTALQKQSPSQHSTFIRTLFGESTPSPVSDDPVLLAKELGGDLEWQTHGLNPSQQAAIRFALASPEIALIHGPPGTGKTHTLIELILQMLKLNLRLLVCGPSNISVDNIVERLAPHKVPMVRLGHPARLLPSVVNHSLDILTRTSDAAALVADIRKEMDEKTASIRKTRSGRERKVIYSDLKDLRKEFRERERNCVDNLVRTSKVVLATLHGAGGYQLKQAEFDVVIIDEASQALEAQCWVPLLTAKKAVLAGDHLQLPPTIKSSGSKQSKASKNMAVKDRKKESEHGETDTTSIEKDDSVDKDKKREKETAISLETTLFDRLLSLHGPSIKRMLTIQYRMHESIMRYPSDALYESKLVAAPSCASHLLSQLPTVDSTDDTTVPVVFYDTQGGDFPEAVPTSDDIDRGKADGAVKKKPRSLLTAESKSNPHEAAIVASHVAALVTAGLDPSNIAVITPYNAQLSLLAGALRERYEGALELGSVDGFQGREKEAVVLSLVRSNDEGDVGFLSEKRRLNVAMTRPRRHLCVVGDSETVSKGGKFLKEWMAWLENNAEIRYPDPSDVTAIEGKI